MVGNVAALKLAQHLDTPVDLLTPNSLHPGLRDRIGAAPIDA